MLVNRDWSLALRGSSSLLSVLVSSALAAASTVLMASADTTHGAREFSWSFDDSSELPKGWMVLYGSGEADLVPSAVRRGATSVGKIAVDPEEGHSGKHSLRLIGEAIGLRSEYIPYDGEGVRIEAWGKVSELISPWHDYTLVVQLYFCDANKRERGHGDYVFLSPRDTQWTHCASGPVFLSTTTKYVYTVVMAPSGQKGAVWLDDLKLRFEPVRLARRLENRSRALVRVDASRPIGPARPFWDAIDVSGADYIFVPEVQRAASIASTSGFRYMRLHNAIFNLCKQLDTAGRPVLEPNFIDYACDRVLGAGMKPIVILESVPPPLSAVASPVDWQNLGPIKDYAKWEDFLYQVIRHLEDRYGREEVCTWLFEAWNEPETGASGYRGNFNELYDHTVAGVVRADPLVRIGGPGSGGPDSQLFKSWLEHCSTGRNFATGARGSRVDFISFHFYLGTGLPAWNAGVYLMETARSLISRYRKYANTPVIVSEWNGLMDPMPQADNGYNAALAIRCLKLLADWGISKAVAFSLVPYIYYDRSDPKVNLMFTGYNNYVTIAGVPKASLNGYRLLNKMRGKSLVCECTTEPVCGLASLSADGGTVRVLLCNWVEDPDARFTTTVCLRVKCPAFKASSPELRVWRVDGELGSAYDDWLKMGSPPQPTERQLIELNAATQIPLTERRRLPAAQSQTVELDLPVQSLALVELEASNSTR